MKGNKGNADPLEGRLAKKARKQTHGDVDALRQVLWRYISRLAEHIEAAEGVDDATIKAGHALTQAGGMFLKCVEVGELEARIDRLEGKRDYRDAA